MSRLIRFRSFDFPFLILAVLSSYFFLERAAALTLGWDDADYLRVTSCMSNFVLSFPDRNLLECERLIYKSPIFVHLGFFSGIIAALIRFFGGFEFTDLIPLTITSLFVVNLLLIKSLSNRLEKLSQKVLLVVFSICFFGKSYDQFMTDTLASLVSGLTILHFTQETLNRKLSTRTFLYQLLLSSIAFGIRTTCAPLLLLPLFIGIYLLKENPRKFSRLFTIYVISLIVAVFFFTSLWRAVIPTAITMAFGSQSRYFSDWVANSGINLLTFTFEEYRFPMLVILVMIFWKLRKLKTLRFAFLSIFPAVLVIVIYIFLSDSKDPRFLMWPLYSIFVFLLSIDSGTQDRSLNRQHFSRLSTLYAAVFALVIFLLYPSNTFGLEKASEVYGELPKQGVVCPLSDSPTLNISKVLLLDSLNAQYLQLNNRILNLPDAAMNGKSELDAVRESEECSIAYFQVEVESGTYKNEYLATLISSLQERNFRMINLRYGVVLLVSKVHNV
jgi:hypothetical protein